MALLTATISGKFLAPTQETLKRFYVIVEAATSNGKITDANGQTVFSGRRRLYPDQAGNITVTLPQLPQAGVAPVGARWRITFPNQITNTPQGWVEDLSDPIEFTLDGNTTWDQLIDVSALPSLEPDVYPTYAFRVWGHSYMEGVASTGVTKFVNDASTIAADILGLPQLKEAGTGATTQNYFTNCSWSEVIRKNDQWPARFAEQQACHIGMWGINDLNQLGNTYSQLLRFREAYRVIVARLRAGAVFENGHSSIAFGGAGTWTDQTITNSSGGTVKRNTTAGGTITITTPPEFPGGAIDLVFQVQQSGGGCTVTATIGGVTYTANTTAVANSATASVVALRVPNLPAGSASYVFTTSAVSVNGCEFDYWQWENPGDDGPWVGLIKQPKPLDYTAYGAVAPGPPTDAGVDVINAFVDELCAEFGSRVYAIDLTSMDKVASYWEAGNVHPTAAGHRKMGELIAAGVRLSGRFEYSPRPNEPRQEWGTAAPSATVNPGRSYQVGDIVWNRTPATSPTASPLGWQCVTAGRAGGGAVFRAMANLV